jgi:hypothetical protein
MGNLVSDHETLTVIRETTGDRRADRVGYWYA